MKYALTLAAVLALAVPAFAHHPGDIDWGLFGMDESQVANYAGPPGDGSTDSTGGGTADFFYINATQQLAYTIAWFGLEGDLTAIHIHGPAGPGQNTMSHLFDVFSDEQQVIDAGVGRRNGFISGSIDLSAPHTHGGGDPLGPAFILDTLEAGQAYINVHTTAFPHGEIRGQVPNLVPEPTTAAALVAFAAVALTRRARSPRRRGGFSRHGVSHPA